MFIGGPRVVRERTKGGFFCRTVEACFRKMRIFAGRIKFLIFMEFNPFDYRPFLVRERVAVEEFTQESPLWERAWEIYCTMVKSPGDKLLFLNDLRFYMVCARLLTDKHEEHEEELIHEKILQLKKEGRLKKYSEEDIKKRLLRELSYEEILQRGCPKRADDLDFRMVAVNLKEYVANPFCGESLGDLSPRGEVPDKIDRLRHDYGLPEDWWFLLKAYLEAHPDDATLDKLYGPSELRNLKTILDSQTSHKQSVEGEEKSAIYHLLNVAQQYKSSVMEFLNKKMKKYSSEDSVPSKLAPIAAFYDKGYFVKKPSYSDIKKSYPDLLNDNKPGTIRNNLSNIVNKDFSDNTRKLIEIITSEMAENLPKPLSDVR